MDNFKIRIKIKNKVLNVEGYENFYLIWVQSDLIMLRFSIIEPLHAYGS